MHWSKLIEKACLHLFGECVAIVKGPQQKRKILLLFVLRNVSLEPKLHECDTKRGRDQNSRVSMPHAALCLLNDCLISSAIFHSLLEVTQKRINELEFDTHGLSR